MKGKELRAIRKRLGLSGRELGELVGVTQNTVARWERDEMGISEPAARLIRIIGGESPEKVLAPAGPKKRTKAK